MTWSHRSFCQWKRNAWKNLKPWSCWWQVELLNQSLEVLSPSRTLKVGPEQDCESVPACMMETSMVESLLEAGSYHLLT